MRGQAFPFTAIFLHGRVATATSSSGVGFAIPVDLVNRVVPALISRGVAPLPGIT